MPCIKNALIYYENFKIRFSLLFKTAPGLNHKRKREVDQLEKLNSILHKAFNAQLTLRNVQSQSQRSKSSEQHGDKALHIQPSLSNSPADVKNIQNALQKNPSISNVTLIYPIELTSEINKLPQRN